MSQKAASQLENWLAVHGAFLPEQVFPYRGGLLPQFYNLACLAKAAMSGTLYNPIPAPATMAPGILI